MKDIKIKIFSTLESDATLKTQLGWTSGDPRIYFWYPPDDIVLSDAKPAFIIYYEISADWHIAKVKEVYVFEIWAKKGIKIEEIVETIEGLLNAKNLDFDNHDCILIVQERKYDMADEKGTLGKHITYRIEAIPK